MARQLTPPAPHRQLRSIAYVAEYMAVDERTVRRYIASGRLRAYHLGDGPKSTVRIDLGDVDSFIVPASRDAA